MDLRDLCQQLLESEKDVPDHHRKIVNNFIEQYRLRRANFWLVERYLRNELRFHVHLTVANNVLIENGERANRAEYCAVIEHRMCDGIGKIGVGDFECFTSINTGDGCTQASMFVDVREFNQESQHPMPIILSMVRLQALDVCVGEIGHPVRNSQMFPIHRQNSLCSIGNFCIERKLTGLEDAPRQAPDQILFDEFEEKMIQGGPEMIQLFARKDGEFDRRRLEDFQLFVSVRIGNDFERFIAAVLGDTILKRFVVAHDPDDFR